MINTLLAKLDEGRIVRNHRLLDDLEIVLSAKIPKLYRAFISTYMVGLAGEQHPLGYNKDLKPIPRQEIYLELGDGQADFYCNFCSLNYIVQYESTASRPSHTSYFKQFGILKIGDTQMQGGIFLGVKKEIEEVIYKYNPEFDAEPIKVADNVYHYLSMLKTTPVDWDYYICRYYKKGAEYQFAPKFIEMLAGLAGSACELVSTENFMSNLKQRLQDV